MRATTKVRARASRPKGRATTAFYFTKGKLIMLEATVLPANGDFGSPDPALFVDSIAFDLSRTERARSRSRRQASIGSQNLNR